MDKKQNNEFATFSWKILKYKLAYYYPERVHLDWIEELTISDADYDSLEQRYFYLARILGKDPRHSQKDYDGGGIKDQKLEFPFDLPCGQLVLKKYSSSKKDIKKLAEEI